MVFSDTSGNTGILQQVRAMMRVDSNQWATANVVNSCNNWFDFLLGYALALDKKFQWDDTNHTKLPQGTTNLVSGQSDYSFLTDEQGNRILDLLRLEIVDSNGTRHNLELIDQAEISGALSTTTGLPTQYDKIADNIVRLYPTPNLSVTSGLIFYFQRSPSYFVATDTTKEPGVASPLHRGFVIASAYDGAMTLGLPNLQPLSVEIEKEKQKAIQYFTVRNNGEPSRMRPNIENCR